MCRSGDAQIGAAWHAPADRRVLARLQHAQQARLRLDRHVADLVEEKRAALRLLEAADRTRGGAGEGSLFMAKELALDQLTRNGGHVDRDEGCGAPLAEVIGRPGGPPLAGAAFARD